MDSRIAALTTSTDLPADAVVAAVHAELSKSVSRIENELFAVIDHCQSSRASSLRENIALLETLLPRLPATNAPRFAKVLGELRVFLRLFEPYMVALRASKSLHPCIAFEMIDGRSGKADKVAMPPMTAVVFASDMEKLLKKLHKARVSVTTG